MLSGCGFIAILRCLGFGFACVFKLCNWGILGILGYFRGFWDIWVPGLLPGCLSLSASESLICSVC